MIQCHRFSLSDLLCLFPCSRSSFSVTVLCPCFKGSFIWFLYQFWIYSCAIVWFPFDWQWTVLFSRNPQKIQTGWALVHPLLTVANPSLDQGFAFPLRETAQAAASLSQNQFTPYLFPLKALCGMLLTLIIGWAMPAAVLTSVLLMLLSIWNLKCLVGWTTYLMIIDADCAIGSFGRDLYGAPVALWGVVTCLLLGFYRATMLSMRSVWIRQPPRCTKVTLLVQYVPKWRMITLQNVESIPAWGVIFQDWEPTLRMAHQGLGVVGR